MEMTAAIYKICAIKLNKLLVKLCNLDYNVFCKFSSRKGN